MIAKRLVFLFPGFEPMLAKAHMERFRRAGSRAAALWDTTLAFRDLEPDDSAGAISADPSEPCFPSLHASHSGEAFATETEIVVLEWGDLILDYAARPAHTRFFDGYAALFDFLATGTVVAYFRTSWRYGLFFAFPLLVLVASLLIGWGGVALLAILLPAVASPIASIVIDLLVAIGLIALAIRRLHLLTALDDWTMALDLIHGRKPAIEARIAAQSRAISDRAGGSDADEIVVAAHSLGASFAVLALSKALKEDALPTQPIRILTVGSSLLKTALHPAAIAQREAVRHLVVDEKLAWTDCQGLSDPINFYKSNPATSLGIRDGRTPDVIRVHFKRMVTPQTYKRIKRNFFRLHRQFVLAVERRCPYSFHMLLTGPSPLTDFARDKTVDRPPLARPQTAPQQDVPQAQSAESPVR